MQSARSEELIASERHHEATLVVPAEYYWKWSGQFENQQRATRRFSWLVPNRTVVRLDLYGPRSMVADFRRLGIIVSAAVDS